MDVKGRVAYVVPMLGRAVFENVASVETGTGHRITLLIGDDRQAGPLYLYIGQKGGQRPSGDLANARWRLRRWDIYFRQRSWNWAGQEVCQG